MFGGQLVQTQQKSINFLAPIPLACVIEPNQEEQTKDD
jgi:hypothetical protein